MRDYEAKALLEEVKKWFPELGAWLARNNADPRDLPVAACLYIADVWNRIVESKCFNGQAIPSFLLTFPMHKCETLDIDKEYGELRAFHCSDEDGRGVMIAARFREKYYTIVWWGLT